MQGTRHRVGRTRHWHTASIAMMMLVAVACGDVSNGEVAAPERNPGQDDNDEHAPNVAHCPSPSDNHGENDQAAAGRCDPGADVDAELITAEIATISAGGNDNLRPLQAEIHLRNDDEVARQIINPSTVLPRVDNAEGVRRLTYLRVNFAHDADSVSNAYIDPDDPGAPRTVAIAPGETLELDTQMRALDNQIESRLEICLQAIDAPHPDSGLSRLATGDEGNISPGFADRDPVELACSGPPDVSDFDSNQATGCPEANGAAGSGGNTGPDMIETPEPEPSSCEQPGPDADPGDALTLNNAALEATDGSVAARLEIANTSDEAQQVILPSSVQPRIDEVDGIRRVSFLRANFIHDDDGVSNSRVDLDRIHHRVDDVTIEANDALTFEDEVQLDPDQIADQMNVCVEVRESAPDGSPAANAATGETSSLMPADIGFGPNSTVPLLCTDPTT